MYLRTFLNRLTSCHVKDCYTYIYQSLSRVYVYFEKEKKNASLGRFLLASLGTIPKQNIQ